MNDIALITLYCIVDDFIKALADTESGRKILASWNPKRGPQRRLSLSEVLTLNILRFHFHIFDLKAFARLGEGSFKPCFPGLPNYENFLKATNMSFPFAVALLGYILRLGRHAHGAAGGFFMDSTPLSVCKNRNIRTHKVAAGFASCGKTGRGWFYGFKLHGACDARGNLVNLCFSPGGDHDSRHAESLTEGLSGLFVGDAGYLLRGEVLERPRGPPPAET